MATRLPVDKLPFESDTEVFDFDMPNDETFNGTKRQYFDRLMALQFELATKISPLALLETAVRKEVDKLIYPDGYPTVDNRQDGTAKFELPGGWLLEFERRINVRIDAAQLPSIREAVEALPIDPDSGEVPTLDGVIRYKPDLSMTNYGTIRDDVRLLLNEALTFTPGTPGIKVVAPKPKAAAKPSDQKAKAS